MDVTVGGMTTALTSLFRKASEPTVARSGGWITHSAGTETIPAVLSADYSTFPSAYISYPLSVVFSPFKYASNSRRAPDISTSVS